MPAGRSMARHMRLTKIGTTKTLPPLTPDGRYIVVNGRLWRAANPGLPPERRDALVKQLMDARRAVGHAKRTADIDAERAARAAVDVAKRAIGERGPPWWDDGAPDLNRRMAKNTCYAAWFAASQLASEV